MKRSYVSLVAMVASIVFASMALADPGTTWENTFNGIGTLAATKGPRFMVLNAFGGQAILDRETGRVWERQPDPSFYSWFDALAHCYTAQVGGTDRTRRGWRLPTIEELTSLVDTTGKLPSVNPFVGVSSSDYWSATTVADQQDQGWIFNLLAGVPPFTSIKLAQRPVWCVRGGNGIDGVQ